MDRQENRREGVRDADDTGLIAGEQLITQAETLLPLESGLPHEDLHAALPEGHAAHDTIDRLNEEIQKPQPSSESIHQHVRALRSLPELEATIANWWDDPKTQRFVSYVSQIGL